MRAYRIGALVIVIIAALLALAVPVFAATPEDVAKNADQMWAAVGGTLALLILGYIGLKVLPGRRIGEILGGIALGLFSVSLIVTAPAWIKFIKDTANKLLAVTTGFHW